MADRIKIVSGERIEVELNKIMMAPHPSIGFEYLQRSGLLQIILPELSVLDIVEKKEGRAHKNNFYHTLEVLENVVKAQDGLASQPSPFNSRLYLRWGALLHDIGKTRSKRWEPGTGWTFHNHNIIGAKMVPGIFRRLKLPMGAEMKYASSRSRAAPPLTRYLMCPPIFLWTALKMKREKATLFTWAQRLKSPRVRALASIFFLMPA